MKAAPDIRLARLLQLASPTLPVGAFSYSQGLESAVEAGVVHDAASAGAWIADVLAHSVVRMEAPVLLRMIDAWNAQDARSVARWNAEFLASREAAELRAETVQMGYSLRRLLLEVSDAPADKLAQLSALDEPAFPAAFAFAVSHWKIEAEQALVAYLWSWLENQAMAALKAVPLGQTDGQRLLLKLGEQLPAMARAAAELGDDELGNFAPRFALLAARHETQYSRLFRS
jgi:urease accessory protein